MPHLETLKSSGFLEAENKLRSKKCKLTNFKRFKAVKTKIIEIKIAWIICTCIELWFLQEQKLGSTKDPIFTFHVFDAENEMEFTNISAKTKKNLKYFEVLRYFRFMKKTRAQKSHATVPLKSSI